jgi:hypothetical protein
MKLWKLRPSNDLPNENPWNPWYDRRFGFVISAPGAEEARLIASRKAGPEGADAWLSETLSTCIELVPSPIPRVEMEDVHMA